MTQTSEKRSPESLGPTLFSRPLRLTKHERRWRQLVLASISQERRTGVKQQEEILLKLDNVLSNLRIINHVLRITYHTPNWGNKTRIIDELIYILLTNRSKIEVAGEQFEKLQQKYPKWELVLAARSITLRNLIAGNGLEDDKVKFIRGSLVAIRERFGRIGERDLEQLSDEELANFLKSLPGVGPKTADCILMYTRHTDVFPADAHCIRTLGRLGVFEELSYTWSQEQHKKAQKDLSLLVPPGMRSDLHRNLIALGKDVCGDKPRCEACELRKFCRYYRGRMQRAEASPTVIDVFAGPGGLSLGFNRAGYRMVAAIESDPVAAKTLRLNHPELSEDRIIVSDARGVSANQLRELLGKETLDVLAGGPPCQGFSTIGKRVHGAHKIEPEGRAAYYDFSRDKRNHLYREIIRLAKALQPRYVLIENVPGLDTARTNKQSYVEIIKAALQAIHYEAQEYKLPVASFGIPQHRKRIFIIAARKDEVLPALDAIMTACLPEDERAILQHAIADLPVLSADDGQWISPNSADFDPNTVRPERFLARFAIKDDNAAVLWNHVSRFQNGQDLQLFRALRPGEDFASLIERKGRQPYMRNKTADNFHDKYYRLDYNGYSRTILSHLGKDGNGYVHPTQTRSLSVREAARIQSFPDDYIFSGGMRAQFTQIGNAVPPVLATAIAKAIIAASPAIRRKLTVED
jgi:DNA (cytosine-5)-methyltransferase 1